MVYVYAWDGKVLTESYVLAGNKGPITAVNLSSDGGYIAAGDVSHIKIRVLDGVH